MRIVYLEDLGGATVGDGADVSLRTGAAGCVWVDEAGQLETDSRVELSANTTHALLGHGVVDVLNTLPIEGTLGEGAEVLIPPAVLEDVCSIFYEADRKTYGASYEFVVGRGNDPEPIEYRLRIDNREYQATLSRLTFLTSSASREGNAVWLRI